VLISGVFISGLSPELHTFTKPRTERSGEGGSQAARDRSLGCDPFGAPPKTTGDGGQCQFHIHIGCDERLLRI